MMAQQTRPPVSARRASSSATGFTLIEIMFALLIVGILLSLLIGGVRKVSAIAKGATDRQAAQNVSMGVSKFIEDFGFIPPLVKPAGIRMAPPYEVELPANLLPAGAGGRNVLSIY